MRSLIESARATVEHHRLLPDGAPVLIMVSGGGDSVALLHMLASGALGERPLRVLHVNHLLRGEESDADQEFVERLCCDLGVECASTRYDVAGFARERGLNLEDAGRILRYRFAEDELDTWCERLEMPAGRGRIATAHTLDDRVETFLMRVAAGAGAGGLASIAALRGRIVRPLLDCERVAVRRALEETGLAWREDDSNDDTSRTRAFVRAKMVPVFEQMNPSFRDSLARTMNLLGDEDALLAGMAAGFARDFADVVPGEVRFNRRWMATLDRVMARRTVRTAVLTAFPDATRLEASHVEALVDAMGDDRFARDLPGGLRAFTEYGTLVVSHAQTPPRVVAPCLLPLPGRARLGPAGQIVARKTDPADVAGGPDSVVIDAGSVLGELVVDSVREGDRMRPLGMKGSRKLSDLLTDEKIPRRERSGVPVVRDGEQVVWLAGVRMSEEYRVTPETAEAVRLTWTRAEGGGQGEQEWE